MVISVLCGLHFVELFEFGVFRFEFRNDLFHQANRVRDVYHPGELFELFGRSAGFGVVVFAHFGDTDPVVCRGDRIFGVREYLLIQFFTRTQSRVFDLDLFAGFVSGQFDHAFGQVGDFHRFTHIENADLIACGDRCGLHDQLAGLGNGHEETGDVRMGDRYRSALGDLLAETRNYRAVRAEDVSETGGYELRGPLDRTLFDGQPERLYVNFGQAFGQPMILVGFTALSVEIITIFSTLYSRHFRATLRVPMTLTSTASQGFSSIRGTCL